MHPSTAKALVDQRHADLARDRAAGSGTGLPARPGWFSRHLPRWHVSWSRTVLSPAGLPDATGGSRAGRPAGSSLVIIVSARRLA
jgi:hypothetical protein